MSSGEKRKAPGGELCLLGIFAMFFIAFLVDIHDLPWEAKILSYVLAPFIFGILIYLVSGALKARWGSGPPQQSDTDTLEDQPAAPVGLQKGGTHAPPDPDTNAGPRLLKALFMGCFLFLSVYFLGFYFGSGLMLLLWFLLFRKVTPLTLAITVATPLLLYVIFGLLIDFGLHGGLIFEWLGG